MNTRNILASLGLVLATPCALASTTWGVGDFLDGVNSTLAKSATAYSTTGTTPAESLQSACIHNYGSAGYGVVNLAEANPCTNEPGTGPHAADNSGTTDMFLLGFNSAVKLSAVTIGWNGTDDYSRDSDMTVLAYTGSASPVPVAGLTLSQLLANNWTVVGNYANVGASNGVAAGSGGSQAISTTISSSWWLVSAWNTAFGGSFCTAQYTPTYDCTQATNTYKDYFKLVSVAGYAPPPPPPGVPEPGSLALLGVGLLGLLRASRKNKQ